MKLTAERNHLSTVLAKIAGIVERKTTIPILQNVVLTAGDGTLTIKGTDLDIEVTSSLPATVEKQGETTVSADMLASIVKKAPSGALISIHEDAGYLHVTFGRSKFKLATMDSADYPNMTNGDYTAEFDIEADQLGRLFGKTAFAMSTEESRYYLNGVYLHPTDEGITAVATDGHKLARVVLDQEADFPGVIVPRKTVGEVSKSLNENPVTVSVSDTKIRFKSGETVIVSKVIDGTFPDYSRVIPTGHPHTAVVVAADVRAASDRVAMVAEDKTRAVALSIGDGVIGLQSRGSASEAEDEVDAEVTGDAVKLGFNSRYLAEALAQCDGGTVTIRYKDAGSPCLIEPSEDTGFMALVMPVRI
jgi:DNA polymerase III subunit beta